MTQRQSNQLLENVATEQLHAKGAGYFCPVHFDLSVALSVVAALQLASRHPGNVGPTAKIAGDVIFQIIARVRADGFLATALLMDLGNDPSHDVPS